MPFLFHLFADPERCHLWMRSRDVFDDRQFYHAWAAWTAEKIAAKFLVERESRPLGLVYEYRRTVEDDIMLRFQEMDRFPTTCGHRSRMQV
jgi:hypothetical protein